MQTELEQVAELTSTADRVRSERVKAMLAARAAGATWRAIAAAAGMTENGVRKALGHKRDPRNA